MVALLVENSNTHTHKLTPTLALTLTHSQQALPGNVASACSDVTLTDKQLNLNTAILPTEYPPSKPGGITSLQCLCNNNSVHLSTAVCTGRIATASLPTILSESIDSLVSHANNHWAVLPMQEPRTASPS